MEYLVHGYFSEYRLPALKGFIADSVDEIEQKIHAPEESKDNETYCLSYPLVIKAQVQTGNRGKAGGIQFVETYDELLKKANTILGMSIKGLIVRRVFITEKKQAKKEMYLSVALDRNEKCPVVMFCAEGGMDINEIAEEYPNKVIKLYMREEPQIKDFMVQYMIDKSGLPQAYYHQLFEVIENLYRLFIERNALLIEINPLIIDEHDQFLCLDGKMDIDDNALYKYPKLQKIRDEFEKNPFVLEARKWNFLYIPIDENANIAVISNGSGMLMSSIDQISQKGLRVFSVLDLGGGATADRIKEAIRIVLSEEKVELLFINIFGGITRCDEIVTGIKLAWPHIQNKKLVLRLEGTNKEIGISMLKELPFQPYLAEDLVEGVERIAKEMGV